ncbi:chaplin, partial [Streptomyces fuscigenes]|uniref:chaplin n=1 Tax=Streptomyces fuscigenes TaxID=1528880 RepID=UPI001F31FD8E
MRDLISKGLLTAAAATSVLSLGGGNAIASDAQGAAAGSPGVLSGNNVQVPVEIPVNLCGNSIDVVGLLNPAFGNHCANVTAQHTHRQYEQASRDALGRASGPSGARASAPGDGHQAAPAPLPAPAHKPMPRPEGTPAHAVPSPQTPMGTPGQAAPAPEHAAGPEHQGQYHAPQQHPDQQGQQGRQEHHGHQGQEAQAPHHRPGGADAYGQDAYAGSGAHASGVAQGSPGVLSGNLAQLPIDIPVNACGNSIDVVGLLNPAFGNDCESGTVPAPPQPHSEPPAPEPPAPHHEVPPVPVRHHTPPHVPVHAYVPPAPQ